MNANQDSTTSLIAKLREFAAAYETLADGVEVEHWYSRDLPSHDFNRELVRPGENAERPEGCVRIMSDTDFYEVANLPLHFEALSCAEVVATLWPDVPTPMIYPDHGDHWWTAIFDESLEVPGQPYELWLHILEDGIVTESGRFEAFPSEPEAVAREARMTSSVTEGREAAFEIKVWIHGTRFPGEMQPRTNVIISPRSVAIVWSTLPSKNTEDAFKRLATTGQPASA